MENRVTFFRFNVTNSKYCGDRKPDTYITEFEWIRKAEKSISDLEWKISQKPQKGAKEELEKLKAWIEKHSEELLRRSSEKTRINQNDINNLNSEIERMNKEGWVVKQMEGIVSGMYDSGTSGDGGYGYGFSYTEGVMVVWERKENK